MHYLYNIWRYALIAYDYPVGIESLFDGCIDFVELQSDMDTGYIVRYPDRIICSYRGTQDFTSKEGFKAWKGNFDNFPLENGKTAHNGFWDAWELLKPQVTDYFKTIGRIKSIKLPVVENTGQSRGGPQSIYSSRHLKKNLGIDSKCVTYGSPRPGNSVFRNEYHMLDIDCIRVVNGFDIAETWPFWFLGFRHVGMKFWLPQPLWHFIRVSKRIRHHIPDNYTPALIALN